MECLPTEGIQQPAHPGRNAGSREFHLVMGGPETSRVTALDESLAADLARDLDGSFEQRVRTYEDRLYSFALRLAGKPEDAEEIAQDAFVRAYRALKTYTAERIRAMTLRAWLYQVTLNVARNRFRGKRHNFVSLSNGGPGEAAANAVADDPGTRPDARFEQTRRRADLASLVAELPERYQSALILRYVEGLRLDEVATILKQPLGTTKSNVHRAINALRAAITESRRATR
jgi:RNA polymerase sigma-70 factor (ECF subfamily)